MEEMMKMTLRTSEYIEEDIRYFLLKCPEYAHNITALIRRNKWEDMGEKELLKRMAGEVDDLRQLNPLLDYITHAYNWRNKRINGRNLRKTWWIERGTR